MGLGDCFRVILMVINAIFLIFGIATLGVGIWILVDFSVVLEQLPAEFADDLALIQGAGIATVVLGSFVFLLSIFGCFGAWKKIRLFLGIFSVIMVVVFGAVLAGAIITLTHQELVEKLVEEILISERENNVTNGLLKVANDEFQCCGIYNLDVCDKTYPGVKCIAGSTACKNNGCLDDIWNAWFLPYLDVAVIVLFSLSGVVAVETLMALLVCNMGHRHGY